MLFCKVHILPLQKCELYDFGKAYSVHFNRINETRFEAHLEKSGCLKLNS